jgi:hypothetical protein
MAGLPPASSPFIGGAKINSGAPGSVGGNGFPGANTNVGTPAGGVNPGAPLTARNNSGSNVGIPYQRLVRTPHTRLKRALDDQDGHRRTADLRAMNLAFIRGQSQNGEPDYEHALKPGFSGPGQRFNELRSLGSVQQHYEVELDTRSIDLGARIAPVTAAATAADAVAFRDKDWVVPRVSPGDTIASVVDDAFVSGATQVRFSPNEANRAVVAERYQGVFTRDDGPFLRGKGLQPLGEPAVVRNGGVGPNGQVGPRNRGDERAFGALNEQLRAAGVFTWQPDGVVLSANSGDPSDSREGDDYLQERDGALFNVRISGPAVTNEWIGDSSMEVLPLDKVFVVVVADCWHNPTETQRELLGNLGKIKGGELPNGAIGTVASLREAYATARESAFGSGKLDTPDRRDRFHAIAYASLTGDLAERPMLTRFRLKLATSSQMVNHSNSKTGAGGQSDGVEDARGRRVNSRARMGLRSSFNVSEVIVGGWCVGSVLDSSASRSVSGNSASIVGVRTAPNSQALQINVSICWWDGDRMYRSFMNRENTLKPRYVAHTGQPSLALNVTGNVAKVNQAYRQQLVLGIDAVAKERRGAVEAAAAEQAAKGELGDATARARDDAQTRWDAAKAAIEEFSGEGDTALSPFKALVDALLAAGGALDGVPEKDVAFREAVSALQDAMKTEPVPPRSLGGTAGARFLDALAKQLKGLDVSEAKDALTSEDLQAAMQAASGPLNEQIRTERAVPSQSAAGMLAFVNVLAGNPP